MRKFTMYSCSSCDKTGQRGSKYFKKMGKEVICLTCNTALKVSILQHETFEEELCENECDKVLDCCDCGGNSCGCRGCWSCNACDDCLSE